MLSIKTKLFADGAKKEVILEMYDKEYIAGFTTNPTLMLKAGVEDYTAFAKDILTTVKNKPISFEVFSDEFAEMEAQALAISAWAENVFVKIPITNTKGQSSVPLIKHLCRSGVKVNVTAMTTYKQVQSLLPCFVEAIPAYVSLFAGRVADCGVDPLPMMKKTVRLLAAYPLVELIWASPRELFNVVQANAIGCHIITLSDDILKKLPLLGKDLGEMSLDTVRMFYQDALKVGYSIDTKSQEENVRLLLDRIKKHSSVPSSQSFALRLVP